MQVSMLVYDLDAARRGRDHFAVDVTEDHVAGVDGNLAFHASATDGCLWPQERHGLTLHIRTHLSAADIIVLQERDQRCSDTHNLVRGYIDKINVLRALFHELSLVAGGDSLFVELVVRSQAYIRLGDPEVLLVIGCVVVHLVGHEWLDAHFGLAQYARELVEEYLIDAHRSTRFEQDLTV